MSNPNLVRKVIDNPSGEAGEVSLPAIIDADTRNRNFIINGNFDIWQRKALAVTFSSNDYYIDRWYNGHTGANEISRRAVTDLPGSLWCWRTTYAGGTSNINDFYYLEDRDVQPLKGKTVTWSFYVRRNGSLNNGFAMRVFKNATANTRNGGSWVEILATPILDSNIATVGNGWSLASVTFTVPNDGTANGLRVNIVNTVNIATNGTYVEVTQMMLNIGTSRAPFKLYAGTLQGEIAACQRYFEKSYDMEVAPGTPASNGCAIVYNASNILRAHIPFRVEKRAIPTMATYDASTGQQGSMRNESNNNSGSYSASDIGTTGWNWTDSNTNAASVWRLQWTANAEFT